MAKISIIESCGQCEHTWHEYSEAFGRCTHPEGHINKITVYQDPIPEWCPLENAKAETTKAEIEKAIRERFKHIMGGKGLIIPRIAVKIAIDDIFGKPDAESGGE